MTRTRVLDWGNVIVPLHHGGGEAIRHIAGDNDVHDRLWTFANGHRGFYGWLRVANERCESIDRIVLLNLPPRDWRGEYLGRVPPEEAADVALDELASVAGIQPP
jgi:hypothetical protein